MCVFVLDRFDLFVLFLCPNRVLHHLACIMKFRATTCTFKRFGHISSVAPRCMIHDARSLFFRVCMCRAVFGVFFMLLYVYIVHMHRLSVAYVRTCARACDLNVEAIIVQ